MTEWKDAEDNAWIDKQLVKNNDDPMEQVLLGKFKLAYQTSKEPDSWCLS